MRPSHDIEMKEPKPAEFSENKPERKKEIEFKVGFLFQCKTVSELLSGLEELSKRDDIRSLMLPEFALTTNDVISSLADISRAAQEKSLDIIMAPSERNSGIPWNNRKQQLKEKGIIVSGGYQDNLEPESIGFYFDKNGSVYAFPKNWDTPIHVIPNTRVGVSVCGEIAKVRLQDLTNIDIDVIYNPSLEGDDPYLKYRMLGLANPGITRKEIHEILLKDDQSYQFLINGPDRKDKEKFLARNPNYSEQEYDESERLAGIPADEREQMAQAYLERLYGMAHNQAKDSSMYVEAIDDALAEKGIVVIRCDVPETTGVLNPHENVALSADYRGIAAVLDIKFTKEGD